VGGAQDGCRRDATHRQARGLTTARLKGGVETATPPLEALA
jgi:hypothetical protein